MSEAAYCRQNTLFIQDFLAMLRWFYVLAHLLIEAGAARRDARIRFLKAQVEILRRKRGGDHVIPSPVNRLEVRFVAHDRDSKFSIGFDRIFYDVGVRRVRTPLLAPDANTFAESWIGSLKRECLNHFLCFGLEHLDHIAQTYVRFHNAYRPHQGLCNRPVPAAATGPPEEPVAADDADVGTVRCERYLGGLLRHYYHEAA